MLHAVYLAGLCQRRNWPDPVYQVNLTRDGYTCVVRVNNREYQTSKYHDSGATAKEAAALIAFNICRSFSVNDGMYPTGFNHGNIIQGRAVPVGSGRAARHSSTASMAPVSRFRGDSVSSGSRSGGSSPDFSDDPGLSGMRRVGHQVAPYASMRHEPQRIRPSAGRR